jgi:hypothetical protein
LGKTEVYLKMYLKPAIDFKNMNVSFDAACNESSAQIQLWLAQMKRDHGDYSGREMEQAEIALQPQQKKARCMFNPFTGEFKRILPKDR